MATQKAYVQSGRNKTNIPPIDGVPVDVAFVPRIRCDELVTDSIQTSSTGSTFTGGSATFNGDVNINEGTLSVAKYADHGLREDVLLYLLNPNTSSLPAYTSIRLGTNDSPGNSAYISWVYRGDSDPNNAIIFNFDGRPENTLEITYRSFFSNTA